MATLKVELDLVVRAVADAAARLNVKPSRCRPKVTVAVMDGRFDVLSVTAEVCSRPDLPSLAEQVFGEEAVMAIVEIEFTRHPMLTRRERRWAGNWVKAYEARLADFEFVLVDGDGEVEFGFLGSSVSGIQGLQFDMIALTKVGRQLQAAVMEMHPTLAGALAYTRQFTNAGLRELDITPENSILVDSDHDQIIGRDSAPTVQFRGLVHGKPAKGTIQSCGSLWKRWVRDLGIGSIVTDEVKYIIPTGVIKGKQSSQLSPLFLIGTNQEFEWGGKDCSLPDKVAGFIFGGLEAVNSDLPEEIKQACLKVESNMAQDLKACIRMAQLVTQYHQTPNQVTHERALGSVFHGLLTAKERALSPEQFEDCKDKQVEQEWPDEMLGLGGAYPWVTGELAPMPLDTTVFMRWTLHETKKRVVRAVKKLGTRPKVFVAGRMPHSLISKIDDMFGLSDPVIVVPSTSEIFNGILVGNPTRDLPPGCVFVGAELLGLDLAHNEILVPDTILDYLDRDCDGDLLAVVKSDELFKISKYVASKEFWPKKVPSNNGGELTLTGENDSRVNDGKFPTGFVAHAIVHGADQIGLITDALNRLIAEAAHTSQIPGLFAEAQLCLDLTTRLKKVITGMFEKGAFTSLFREIVEVEGMRTLRWFSSHPDTWCELLPDRFVGPGLTRMLQIGTGAFLQGTDALVESLNKGGKNSEFRKYWYNKLHGKQLQPEGLPADSVTRQALNDDCGIGAGLNPSQCRAVIMGAPVFYQGTSITVDSTVGVCFRRKSWDKLPWWLWAHFDALQIAGFGILEQLVVQAIDSGYGRARVKGYTITVTHQHDGQKTIKKLIVKTDDEIIDDLINDQPDYVL